MKNRNVGIDILKSIAMIFIISTHASWTTYQRSTLLFPFWIDLAVPVLIIVTGYNYYNSYVKNANFIFKNKSIFYYLTGVLN